MNKIKKWKMQCDAKEIVKILNDYNYNAIYLESSDLVKEKVLELIPKGSSIALGGSVTLDELDIIPKFRTSDYKLFDRYIDAPFSEIVEIMRESMTADYLVTSTNAITRNGELVNTDSGGNRAAGILFGPKNVIIVAGVNKVVDDLNSAFKRINEVAIMNAKRINHKCPCTEDGKCHDCSVRGRICNFTSIVHNGMKFKGRITIIIVPEELGF